MSNYVSLTMIATHMTGYIDNVLKNNGNQKLNAWRQHNEPIARRLNHRR
jgi:hypothetical protein